MYIPDELIARLQALASETGIRWTEHIRAAIFEYLKKEEERQRVESRSQ